MRNKLFSIALVGILVIATSCAKVPQLEIDNANATIALAKTAGADIYQPEQLAAVQDSMNMIMEQIEAQKSKLIPSYGDIKTKLAELTNSAMLVKTSTEERKETIRQEIQGLIAEVKALNGENNNLVATAPKGKEGVAALEMIKTDISVTEKSVEEAELLLSNDNLFMALDKINAAQEKAAGINQELKTVIEKAAKKNKR